MLDFLAPDNKAKRSAVNKSWLYICISLIAEHEEMGGKKLTENHATTY